MVLRSNFFKGNLTSLQLKVHVLLVPVLCKIFSEKHVKAPRKQKEEVFFHQMGTIPSFFVNCSMEFLFGQKMELIF